MLQKYRYKRFFIITGSIVLSVGFFLTLVFIYLSSSLPTIEEIARREIAESTKIYDRTGQKLLFEIFNEEKRTVLSFEEIPQIVKEATIAAEDKNFYRHNALDWKAILRVIFVNLKGNVGSQGGSTITQQLAKNAFLNREKTLVRKIKEIVLAYRIERVYSKDEILWSYLNTIPYGQNAYGIETASQVYFGKSAKDLNLSEVAMIVALPQAPSYLSPWGYHTKELENRRIYVLSRMEEEGYISEREKSEAIRNKPVVKEEPIKASFNEAPHFIIYIKEYLEKKYGSSFIERSGLKITTTLDLELQKHANQVVKELVNKNTENYEGYNGALIAEDPKTGEILAMVGSKDFFEKSKPDGCKSGINCKFEGQFNIVTQGLRQPGSSFKPFVYLAGLTKGLTANTILFDVPTEFSTNREDCPSVPNYNDDNIQCYHPQNYDRDFSGPITLKESLARSINITAVKILYLSGLDYVLELAQKFGITTLTDKDRFGLSLVLGGGEVKMIEMAKAYSVLAADGISHKQAFILKIEDKDGKILESYKDQSSLVVEPVYAQTITNILADRELRAKLFQNSLYLTEVPGYQIALKTGTTNNYVDAWTFGYTPNLVVGVWAGNNDRSPLQKKGSSILAAIPMWHAFMEKAVTTRPNEKFTDPEPLTSDIPMIRGELDKNNIHNILYFLGRLNDPQFQNWEDGVQNWLLNNKNYVAPSIQNTSMNNGPVISSISPQNGSFLKENSLITADISSNIEINRIELFINKNLIQTLPVNSTSFSYQFAIDKNLFETLPQQNLISLKAFSGNKNTTKEIIVFK